MTNFSTSTQDSFSIIYYIKNTLFYTRKTVSIMSSFKKIQSSQLTSKSTPKSSPRPSATPQPARLPSLSPNTAEEQREEDERQRQALAKPKLEIRSIEQLREHINSIKHCRVDNLHDPNDSRTVPFSESIEYLKGQQATKFSVRVWKDGKRVL